jgi:hypothetical protein
MGKSRFDKAFARFIDRGEEKVTPRTFFEVLEEIERERAQRTIVLRARVVKGQLEFQPSPDISVRSNEIIVGNQRIIVKVS